MTALNRTPLLLYAYTLIEPPLLLNAYTLIEPPLSSSFSSPVPLIPPQIQPLLPLSLQKNKSSPQQPHLHHQLHHHIFLLQLYLNRMPLSHLHTSYIPSSVQI